MITFPLRAELSSIDGEAHTKQAGAVLRAVAKGITTISKYYGLGVTSRSCLVCHFNTGSEDAFGVDFFLSMNVLLAAQPCRCHGGDQRLQCGPAASADRWTSPYMARSTSSVLLSCFVGPKGDKVQHKFRRMYNFAVHTLRRSAEAEMASIRLSGIFGRSIEHRRISF